MNGSSQVGMFGRVLTARGRFARSSCCTARPYAKETSTAVPHLPHTRTHSKVRSTEATKQPGSRTGAMVSRDQKLPWVLAACFALP